MKIRQEIRRDILKSIMINELNIKYFSKVEARELLEHRMPVNQREQIKNTIIIAKANIVEANIKLEMLEKL